MLERVTSYFLKYYFTHVGEADRFYFIVYALNTRFQVIGLLVPFEDAVVLFEHGA